MVWLTGATAYVGLPGAGRRDVRDVMSLSELRDGHEVAWSVRRKGDAALHLNPPADRLFLWGLLVILMIGGAGLWAGVWWASQPPPPARLVEMRVGSERFVVPGDYFGPRAAEHGREVGMVRLRVTWPEMTPPAGGDRAEVHVAVGPADPTTDPRAQFGKLARFLQPGAWSNPGGLVARNFKPGSPFEGEELYMSLPDGEEFFARCTAHIGPNRLDEGCRAVLKHGPVDIALRFPRDALIDWRTLTSRVRARVDGFRHSQEQP